MAARGVAAAFALGALASARAGAAAPDTSTPTVDEPPDVAPALPPMAHNGYWSQGRTRAFVSGTFDVGYLYARPRISLGYGRPHYAWVGVDVNPLVNSGGLGGYGGLRLAAPFADLRFGVRGFAAFQHTYLPVQPSYDVLDLASESGTTAKYANIEAELTEALAIGPGSLLVILTGSYILGVPDQRAVYEETIHVIAVPPWLLRERVGYAVRLGAEGNASVGLLAELIELPMRGIVVFRGGLVGSFAISDHVELLGTFVPQIYGRDQLGAVGGDFAQLGIRWRWATGE
jgi:hypothetical protein